MFSRLADQPKEYVQDRMRTEAGSVNALIEDPATHIFICGLKGMEDGVEAALADIAGEGWPKLRERMREEGRFHIETY